MSTPHPPPSLPTPKPYPHPHLLHSYFPCHGIYFEGEVALMESGLRTATVVAETDVMCLSLTRRRVLAPCSCVCVLYRSMLRQLPNAYTVIVLSENFRSGMGKPMHRQESGWWQPLEMSTTITPLSGSIFRGTAVAETGTAMQDLRGCPTKIHVI